MNVNRSKGAKSHRDLDQDSSHYLEPLPGIAGDEARRHDNLVRNILRFVNILSSETLNCVLI